MAASSPTAPLFPTDENTDPNSTNSDPDPFWSSTPRTVPPSPEVELMMAVRQVVPAPPNNAQKHKRMSHAPARRPQCTHMTMNRLYGEHECHNCHRVPNIGFVYSCQQDRFLQHSQSASSTEALPIVADTGDYFEAQAKVAESLGMSGSVIKQMTDAEYSYDQIEKLLQQRRHVLDIICKTEGTSAQSSAPPTPQKDGFKVDPPLGAILRSSRVKNVIAAHPTTSVDLPMSPAGTPANTPSISATSSPTKSVRQGKWATCNFQVCHSCRPFFPDRLYTSFDAVCNNELPPIDEEDACRLRVLDATVVSNLGLRPVSLRPKLAPILQHDGDADSTTNNNQGDEYDDDISPTDTTTSNDSRFYYQRYDQDLLPCPGQGHCPVWSETEGCAYYNGFDDGKRAINHAMQFDDSYDPETLQMAYEQTQDNQMVASTPTGSSSAGSSISLPEPKLEPLTPTSPDEVPFGIDLENRLSKVGKAATVCGVLTKDGQYNEHLTQDTCSNSSRGEEVELDGGVALTEEAVERRMSDIATSEQ